VGREPERERVESRKEIEVRRERRERWFGVGRKRALGMTRRAEASASCEDPTQRLAGHAAIIHFLLTTLSRVAGLRPSRAAAPESSPARLASRRACAAGAGDGSRKRTYVGWPRFSLWLPAGRVFWPSSVEVSISMLPDSQRGASDTVNLSLHIAAYGPLSRPFLIGTAVLN
jgi:hypothetical protein